MTLGELGGAADCIYKSNTVGTQTHSPLSGISEDEEGAIITGFMVWLWRKRVHPRAWKPKLS